MSFDMENTYEKVISKKNSVEEKSVKENPADKKPIIR
jgi:hypothetical protein